MTAAETALVDAYTAQIGELPGDGAVTVGARHAACRPEEDRVCRRVAIESWHYTDLRALLASVPACRSDRIRANGSIRWLPVLRCSPF